MKKILSHATPLKFAIAYILVAIIWLIIANANDPSLIGWALTFATGMLIFAAVLLVIDLYLIQNVRKSVVFWMVQLILFFGCIWVFVKVGLPGRL